ncbi:unnamed protein product [Schistosoma curassoni]|uniref:Fibronectin type-III domain-containing protein n=1 Tax=Schistosoma curassoni TaxID=6186 RepID=A0A3P7ZNQ9_9TREM|nr:unnamed protein product [Schistosoma curassoni]
MSSLYLPLDKPQPPSDVEAKDIYADSCVLTWSPPESDGGCPIIGKIKMTFIRFFLK